MSETRYTDTDLINFLEGIHAREDVGGLGCVFRWPKNGKGWKLCSNPRPDARPTVREAIVKAVEKEKER